MDTREAAWAGIWRGLSRLEPGIIPPVVARKLLQGARAATGAARHLAWYLSYCVDGSATRSCPPDDVATELPLSRVG